MQLTSSQFKGSTIFVAPFAEYDFIHKAAIRSIDVSSSGELGVSADINSLNVWDGETGVIQVINDICEMIN
jgi:hypothetical protein